MKLCWLTDIHLNFLEAEARADFYQRVQQADCDAVLISGDIADAPVLDLVLQEMAAALQQPIYFVLGNHDYYRSQINEVRTAVHELCGNNSFLHWLAEENSVMLNNHTILLGQDGWADGRYGDYQHSSIVLNDSRFIADLFQAKILGQNQLLQKMQELSDIDAEKLKSQLTNSIKKNIKKIIILTHVPPFDGACWHEGEISDKNWMPFFTSKAMGEVILKFAKRFPAIEFLVLCGHTHSEGVYNPLENLLVKAGHAEYYSPEIQEVISNSLSALVMHR